MDKDKSPAHGGGFPPPSGRYSGFLPTGAAFNVKPELSSSSLFPPLASGASADSGHFSHDISRMPDNPPRKLGHRRAHSEILTLPDDISFDSDLGVVGGAVGPSFSDETEEDLFSMYLDMEKFNSSSATSSFQFGEPSSSAAAPAPVIAPVSRAPTSSAENIAISSNERLRVRHQHSQSMDGSSTIKPEMLVSSSEDINAADSKKALSAAKLAELAMIDPKRAKRIWANRQSAARSKERKMRYIVELEQKVQTLQTEATSLSAQLTLLQRDTNGLTAENSALKLRLQTMEQQVHLQDALNDALKEEIQHLKVVTGQAMPNGGPVMNYACFGGAGQQQFYPTNQAMHTLLTAQQFQQLQIHSQKQQHQFQQHQLQQQQQQQQSGDLKLGGSVPSPSQKEKTSESAARSKERKMRYIVELEQKVQTLQTEATSLSAQLTLLQRDTNGLTAENSALKLRLQTMEQQVHLQDALNDALKEEIQHLKVVTGQAMPNGGPVMNYACFGGAGQQQFYPTNQAMHTLLTAQQFQQLQIHSQKQQHQFQQHQLQQQQQQQQSGDLKLGGSVPSPSQKEKTSEVNQSVTKDC